MSDYKIGFHTGPGGNRNGIGDYFRGLTAAGIRAHVKSVDDYGPCWELIEMAKWSGIDHQVVFRLSTAGQSDGFDYDVPQYNLDPIAAAYIHWQATLAKLPPEFNRDRCWLEVINEVDKDKANWLGAFACKISELALEQGYKVLLFGWSAGEPETVNWLEPDMIRFLRLAEANPDRVGVALHEYSYQHNYLLEPEPIWMIGRFIHLFAAVDSMGIGRPTIFITEFGWTLNTVQEPATAVWQLYECAVLYAKYPEIKAAAIWYLGPGFGGIADFAQRLIAPVTQEALDWANYEPSHEYVNGIDSSHWNGELDGDKCVEAGNVFYFAKASDGWTIVADAAEPRLDPLCQINTSEAIRAGLKVGLYHYFRPDKDAMSQAELFLDILTLVDAQHLPPALDFEEHPPAGMSVEELREALLSWLLMVEMETGQTPFLYTNKTYYDAYLDFGAFDRFPIFVANYTSADEPAMPNRRDDWEIWQWDYTGGGIENGVKTYDVDKNRWLGTKAEFLAKYSNNWLEEGDEPMNDQERWDATIQEQIDHGLQLADTAIQNAIRNDGLHPVTKEMYVADEPPMMAAEDWSGGGRARRVYLWENGQIRWFNDPSSVPPSPPPPPPPPPSGTYDLVSYFVPVADGNGPIYEVMRADGSQERIQTQVDALTKKFWITKGTGGLGGKSEFEELAWDGSYIYRGLDTSPGFGRFYVQYEPGKTMARWMKRFVNIGEGVNIPHWVQFFDKGSCQLSSQNSGSAVNLTQLFGHHDNVAFNGLVIQDVIHLGKPGGEEFWFAKGIGMIGWKSGWNESYISELHPDGQRPDNQKESVCNYNLP